MRRLRWSVVAGRELEDYLDWVRQDDPGAATRARLELRKRAGSLRQVPAQGRPSRWPGWRELTVSRWKKIILYEVRPHEILVIALLDSRRDLTSYIPRPE